MDAEAPAQAALDRLLKLGESGVPVLRATVEELARLEAAQEQVSSTELATAILRDPLMTLRILQFLYSHRTRSQTQDITTIAHAIMMLGLKRFFREFAALPTIEERLAAAPETLNSAYARASRARLASLFARDWATQRHDMDPEEVMVAALVHDVTDLLVLCEWPQDPPALPAAGNAELRAMLFARLGLPGLLSELTADTDTQHPRILNVSLACALAHCCDSGWSDACLDDLLHHIQRLLHISEAAVWERIRRVALQAAREWRFYQIRPAAAYLPLLVPAATG